MPTVPTNPKCATLGCTNPKARYSTQCTAHGGRDTYDHKRYNKDRKQSDAKYASTQWRKLRQIQLSRDPICAACKAEGIIKTAEHVDHVFPWRQIGEQAFTLNIYQSLCLPCHTSKTYLEQKGIFRRYGNPNRDYTFSDYRLAVANL